MKVLDDGKLPPSQRQGINSMGDKFREAQKGKPAAIAPATAPPKPAEAPKPAPAAPPSPTAAPAPATTPKPAEVEPEMPKNAKDWKSFKEAKEKVTAEAKAAAAERDALKAEQAALKAELDTLKKGSAEYERVKSEHEALRKQYDTQQEIIDRVALEHTPKFQEHYMGRIKGFADGLSGLVTGEALTKAQQLLSLQPSALRKDGIKALIGELQEAGDHVAASAVTNAFLNISIIEGERNTELARASENMNVWKANQAKREQEEQAELQRFRKALTETAYQRIDPELAGGDPEVIKHLKEQTRQFIDGKISEDNLLDIVTHAAKGRKYDDTVKTLLEQVETLKTQVAELTSATPPANGTGGGTRINSGRGLPDNSEVGSKFRAEVAKRQGVR